MGKFIFSPILSLFSRRFYGEMSRSSLGQGVLYLLSLAFVVSIVSVTAFSFSILPKINQGAQWVRENMPPLEFTREGVQTTVQQPFSLTHPEWGTILIVDTNRETVTDEEMRQTIFYITKTKLYAWDRTKNEHRIVDARPQPGDVSQNWQDVHVDGEVVWRLYAAIRPFASPLVFVVVLFSFFAWKMAAAFFYSIPALLINILRKQKLAYEKLLNLCFFALTPVMFLQAVKTVYPGFIIPVNFWLAFVVTCGYLAFAILATQEPDQPVS